MYLKIKLDIRCSDEEKKEIKKLIESISDIADFARESGLLHMLVEYPSIDNIILKSALEFIGMGIDPVVIGEHFFKYHILSENFENKKLLERYIIYEGIIGIQGGYTRRKLRILLLSMLGEKYVYDELFSGKIKE
jgi:flagellar motor component MotA